MASNQKPAKQKHFHFPPTFFNKNLLDIDPFALRDELFGRLQLDDNAWALVENLKR